MSTALMLTLLWLVFVRIGIVLSDSILDRMLIKQQASYKLTAIVSTPKSYR